MVTDKNGTQLEPFDIVYVDLSGIHGHWRSYTALIIKDQHGELMECSSVGVSRVDRDCAVKVGHFPSTSYHLPREVEAAYIRHLKELKDSINDKILDFIQKTNKAKAGDIDGRKKNVRQDDN